MTPKSISHWVLTKDRDSLLLVLWIVYSYRWKLCTICSISPSKSIITFWFLRNSLSSWRQSEVLNGYKLRLRRIRAISGRLHLEKNTISAAFHHYYYGFHHYYYWFFTIWTSVIVYKRNRDNKKGPMVRIGQVVLGVIIPMIIGYFVRRYGRR